MGVPEAEERTFSGERRKGGNVKCCREETTGSRTGSVSRGDGKWVILEVSVLAVEKVGAGDGS